MKKLQDIALLMTLSSVLILTLTGCSGGSRNDPPKDDHIKRVSLQMTTFCENDPYTTLQYNFARNIGDGAGITFGCIGFTTGTFSGNIVIQHYTALNPNNVLAKYIPALNRIDSIARASGGKTSDTTGLDNFIQDVQNCFDPLFRQAQIYILNQKYWNPAVNAAAEIGAIYPISLAFIYDMCVNHGAEGAQRYINQTNTAMGGSPKNGIDEKQWLTKCISIRYNAFKNDRCYAYLRVLNSGNLNLVTPFPFTCYGDTATIDGNVGY